MEQRQQVIRECRKIIDVYQEKKIREYQEKVVPDIYQLFYNAVIENKDMLYGKIIRTRNVNELAVYMRDGSFAEDAGTDFATQMFAASLNSQITSDYDDFIKKIRDVLAKYNYDADDFERYAELWSNRKIQPVMQAAEERRLQIVEIGTGVGTEAAKKLHGFVFGKATEIAITVIWQNPRVGKTAGKAMRVYLGTGEFKAQRNTLAKYVSDHIEEYANEIAIWVRDGYNDIYTARSQMAEQILNDYKPLNP